MMTERSPEPDPAHAPPEGVEGVVANQVDADTRADELLAEQIEEAQDSAT